MKIERPLTVYKPGCLLWIPVLRSFGTKIVVWNLHWQELQLLLSQISHQYYLHCRIFALAALLTVSAGVLTKMAAKLYRSVSVLGAENFEPILSPIKQQRDWFQLNSKYSKVSKSPNLSFGMVHVKHIRPWHVAIVGSLFVDCLGRRNQLQNPHKRIPVTFITKPKQWATKMFPVWCDQRSTLGTMCPVRQITFPDTRPAGTVC